MKKIVLVLIFIFLSMILIGCQEKSQLRIITPAGSPTLAQLYMQEDAEKYSVDVVNGADPLVAAFMALTPTHDIIFAPTNLGARSYNSGSNYLFAGTVVWGNYYLISKDKTTFDMASLEGQEIIVFGQNQTSDIIIKYLIDELNISVTIDYVDSVANAAALYMADQTKIVMVAEPTLSTIASKVASLQVIDLQAIYEDVTGESSYPQSGIFVLNTLSKRQINQVLNDLKDSIDQANDNPSETGILAEELEIGFTALIVEAAIPNSHLNFTNALDSRAAIEDYFNRILALNPALIGNALPGDDFYYQP
jgi:NitT/TauT family transport system substrate-binding protein